MPAKRVSIFQVAQAAGVSHQTVSRVINDSPKVSANTRAKVLKVIDELGYRPSGAARALATRKSKTIALIAGGISYYGPLSTIASVESTARKHGLHVSISIMNEAEYTERDFTQVAHSSIDHGADAFVFVASTDAMLQAALQVKVDVPRVILTSAKGGVELGPWLEQTNNIAVLGIDQHNAIEQIVAHLSEQGHKRLLYMSGPQEWRDAATRKSAWLDAVRASLATGNPLQTQIIDVDDWSAQSAYDAMNLYIQTWKTSCARYQAHEGGAGIRHDAASGGVSGADDGRDSAGTLLKSNPHVEFGLEHIDSVLWPTAIVAANDLQAFGIRRALYEHGIRVPEDVSLVGFDDMPVADNAIPPLTTIRPNFSKLGVEAMAALLRMLGEQDEASAGVAGAAGVAGVATDTIAEARTDIDVASGISDGSNADVATGTADNAANAANAGTSGNAANAGSSGNAAIDSAVDHASAGTTTNTIELFDAPLIVRASTAAPCSIPSVC